MKVRVYTNTNTSVNENWNPYGLINSAPSNDHYKHPLIEGSPNSHWNLGAKDIQRNFYQKIGIDIVTETVFNYPGVQITEKTMRPIINKRPFIIVGAAHTLDQIARLPIDKIRNFVLKYTPVLEHNFNILKNLEQQELAAVADKLSKL
jgi:hypothetical protein